MKLTKKFWIRMLPMLVVVLVTMFFSLVIYTRMMEFEKEHCWEQLETATISTANNIENRLNDNMNFLESVSDSYVLTKRLDDVESIGEYLSSVVKTTMFDRIDVILPDNSVITQQGEILNNYEGVFNYDELVKKGTHISPRVTSYFTGRDVVCCATAIKEADVIRAVLIGTIDCVELSRLFEVSTYEGKAQFFLIDREDGNYIIDNWHEELGNIHELGERKSIDGINNIDIVSDIMNGESKRHAYVSNTNGKNTYQYCVPVEGFNWELCVAVQEDVIFAHANDLRDTLFSVGIFEAFLVVIYFVWNIWLMAVVTKSEEKAKKLELERIKTEDRTKFISNMSHDIRTPLNGIVGMLQIIRSHRDEEDVVDESLRKIEISTQYLSTLANDVLDINEIENNKLVLQEEPINLKVLIDELEVMVEQRARDAGVTYYIDYSGLEYPNVVGSEVHIKRILVNLIGNAIKYSRDAGKTVWITAVDEVMSFDKLSRMYKFIVKDNGIGMSEQFQKNMYNAFEQEVVGARSDYQGYGLGLTIVKHLVKKMEGEIKIESVKGKGSTFTVCIPLKLDESGGNSKSAAEEQVDLKEINILLVEDNALNMEIAEVILTDAGATVEKATDGKMATEMFGASEMGTYDLILMDIMMPRMDGCEAARVIRAMDRADAKTVPIIAMTASAFAEEIKRCKDSGMNSHIAKPLDVSKLMRKIVKYCEKINQY